MPNVDIPEEQGELQSACRPYSGIMQMWDRDLAISRFVSVFTRDGATALYNSLNGRALYLPSAAVKAIQPLLDGKTISPGQMASLTGAGPGDPAATAVSLNDLIGGLFVRTAGFDEDEFIERMRAAFPKPQRFENLTVYLTSGCNLHCDYCQLHTKPQESKKAVVDIESFKQAVEVFFSSKNGSPNAGAQGRRRKLQLFGGEPLMEWTSLVSIVEYIRSCEESETYGDETLDISVNTNGVLLTDERLLFLKKNHVYVSVSIDGAESEHDRYRKDWSGRGSFQRVIKNVQRAKELGLNLTVLSVLGAHNLSTLPQFIRSMRDDCGIVSFGLNPIFGDSQWQDRFSVGELRKQLISVIDELLDIEGVAVRPFCEQWWEFASGAPMLASQECTLGTRLVLFPSGNVAPCVDYAFRPNIPRISSFESLHPSTVWTEVGSKWSLHDPNCYRSCPLIGFCDGGCPVNAQRAGDAKERPFCNLSWALLECFVWRKHRITVSPVA